MSNNELIVLIPAYNEGKSIANTIKSVLAQTRQADRVVVIPNGCTDDTADVARGFPATVMELPKLEHRKSEALNRAWLEYGQDAFAVVCLDADTVLPTNAFADWYEELSTDTMLGASSSKFTAQGTQFLERLQKSEYSAWADVCLQRGETRVVSGTGSVLRGSVLFEVAQRTDREGPWSYKSATEDFELTYRIRRLDYKCHTSPTVRAYTDTMKDMKSLWAQRLKWQAGTIEDLLSFGFNRHTYKDWGVQAAGMVNILVLFLTTLLTCAFALMGELTIVWYWLALPVLVSALEVKKSLRIPHRNKGDVMLAATLIPVTFYMWFRAVLLMKSWYSIGVSKILNRKQPDLWGSQYVAEGV